MTKTLKTVLRIAELLLMLLPVYIFVRLLIQTGVFTLDYLKISSALPVILCVLCGLLLPGAMIVLAVRRLKNGEGVFLPFLVTLISTVVLIPIGFFTLMGAITSHTDDLADCGVYDEYVSEEMQRSDAQTLMPSASDYELVNYSYEYTPSLYCFHIYSEMKFKDAAAFEAEVQRLEAHGDSADADVPCNVSKIGSGRGLTAFWTADEATQSVKIAVVYDEDLYAHPKKMFDAHGLSELFG